MGEFDMAIDADIIAAFNAADTWQEALAAIKANAAALGLSADSLTKLADLPDNGGREQAIGLGVNEIKDLFGHFNSVADIKVAVEQQIAVEHAKFVFISAVDGAGDAAAMAVALAQVATLNADRQALINEWSASSDPDAVARAVDLADDAYTIVLKEIASHLTDPVYMADLSAKMLAARGTLPGGQFFGDGSIVTALQTADAVIDLVAAFNAADTWQEALAAIKANAAALGLSADSLTKLADLPDNGGREQAIGLGVNEIKDLFGHFNSVADIKVAVEQQIAVEHAKFVFISAVDGAGDAAAMAVALAQVATLNADRQALINEWSASSDPDAVARAADLADDAYTIVLKEIASHLTDPVYMADLSAKMLAARGTLPGGQFFGDGKIVTALQTADAVIDLVAAFNAADTWQEALAAIKANAAALGLSADSLTKLADLPDNGGREQAIGLGVNEIKDLFGHFNSVADIKVAVEQQIAVEHAKFVFISAVDGAGDAAAMAVALAQVATLNADRQALINEWSASSDPDAVARAADLADDAYTIVLKEIASHLTDPVYMADLSAKMLAARGTLPGGQFFGDGKIVTALQNADAVIDLVAAFNAADTWQEALAAIKANAAALGLSADSLTKLADLPDNGGREQAIGLGVNEIKDPVRPLQLGGRHQGGRGAADRGRARQVRVHQRR